MAVLGQTFKRQRADRGHDEFRRIVVDHRGDEGADRLIEQLAQLPDPE